jgi:sulfate permease, SulP family
MSSKNTFMRRGVVLGIGAGILVGIVELIFSISFAALLFRGQDAGYLANGIGLILIGAIPTLLLIALFGSYKGYISVPQDAPAVIMALVVVSITQRMAAATARERFITVAVVIGLTTVLTGVLLIVMGQFKLGSLVRFLPYPVIGGFLAGTGWLLVIGGIEFMTDVPFRLANLSQLFQPDIVTHWLPGLLAGAVMLWVLHRFNNFFLLPGMLLAFIALFYGVATLSQTPLSVLSAQGWLMGPFTNDHLLQSMSVADARLIDWRFILEQSVSLASVMLISLASLLLNISGIELAVRQDIDLNRELRTIGLGNVLSGFLGGAVSYPSISTTAFNHKISGGSQLVPLVAAGMFALPFLFGVAVLSYVPKMMIGAMLIVFGLSFLFEWVYQAWWKFSKLEYAIIVLIVASVAALGFLPGIAVGFAAAVTLFVVNYSRISVTKHALSGVEVKSRVARSLSQRAMLIARGHQTLVLKLQGYIFFGTAHALLEDVRKRVEDKTQSALRFLILDFEKVSGLDSSAMLSLGKMKQVLDARSITLLVTGPSEQIQQQLRREAFLGEGPENAGIFADVDHGMERVENTLLKTDAQPINAQQPLRELFTQLVPNDALLDALFEFLERRQVATGEYLMRQAESADGIYFVESGQVTAQLEFPAKQPVRLETMGSGHVIGELGFYLGQQRTASVIADAPSVVYSLSANSLARMEATAPEVASYFHRLIIQLLAARTTHLIRVVEALEK